MDPYHFDRYPVRIRIQDLKNSLLRIRIQTNFSAYADPGKNDTDPYPDNKRIQYQEKLNNFILKNTNLPFTVCLYYLSINFL